MLAIEFLLCLGMHAAAECKRLTTCDLIILTMFLHLIIVSRTRTTREIHNISNDLFSAHSRTEFIIKCLGLLITWKFKRQTEIVLSSTESEYTDLSSALRETITVKQLLKEIGIETSVDECSKTIKNAIFEDNNDALDLAKTPKVRPRTKHINEKCHHIRSFIERGIETIELKDTGDQEAIFLAKPLVTQLFSCPRKKVTDWRTFVPRKEWAFQRE